MKTDKSRPVILKRTVRKADMLSPGEKEATLHLLHLAIYTVNRGLKLSARLQRELAVHARRITETDHENLIPTKVHAAVEAGHPLSTAEPGKESAFEVVAKEYDTQPETLRDRYYRLLKLSAGNGLPIVAGSAKPRRKK